MQSLISPLAAAKHYGVTRVTIYRWIKSGVLDARKIGGVVRVQLASDDGPADMLDRSSMKRHKPEPPDGSKARGQEPPREAASEGRAVKRPARGKKIRGLVKRPGRGKR